MKEVLYRYLLEACEAEFTMGTDEDIQGEAKRLSEAAYEELKEFSRET